MHKVVINACFGGFGLSNKAVARLRELGLEFQLEWDIPRHHPLLVQVVEELGEKASGSHAKLEVVEINSNLYKIDEYDGLESVSTPKDHAGWISVFD
jgi:hypothetical protein